MNIDAPRRRRPSPRPPINALLILLLGVLGMVIGQGAVGAPSNQWPVLSVGSTLASGALAPILRSDLAPLEIVEPRTDQVLAVAQAGSAILPEWVQAVRRSRLWSSEQGETALSSLRQWQLLRVIDASPARFLVEVEADDGTRTQGWIDFDDAAVTGAPPSWVQAVRDTFLFASADAAGSANIVSQDDELMLAGPALGSRVQVYYPMDPTSRRSGLGWVEADAIIPGTAPRGVAVPAPGFRPLPVGRSDVYRVQPGDSLTTIADGYGLSAEGLATLNSLDSTRSLQVGQVVRVPTLEAARSVASAPREAREAGPPRISAQYAVVVDEASGQVLWSRDANTPVAPASLTKIVTTLVTLDYARLTDLVTVRVDSRRMPGSTVMGLYPGEELTVEDLLYGLMLPSGNDAALALAEHVAGTKENFAVLMDEKARSLGLTGSTFVNPHGLDAVGHASTAYDMAMLAREGMRDPTFRALSSAQSYSTPRGGGYRLGNLNQLLRRYEGADGVKIGFTNAAGRAIVGSAVRDGHRVYVAMMRSGDIYADSAALLDWAFSTYSWP